MVKETEKEQIELIDVGGPSLLRASAKNFEKITVICDPKDYPLLENPLSIEQRKDLAVKVFYHTSLYDSKIAQYFQSKVFPYIKQGSFFKKLRYGENPNQKAHWYKSSTPSGLHQAEILQGKALSFNNILDIQSSLNTLREFQEPAFVGVKHNNPCGVALADSLEMAIQKGLKADPLSIFGAVVSLNKKVSLQSATQLISCFLECIIAPDYSEDALKLFSKKKNLRILKWPNLLDSFKEDLIYAVDGGFMVQNSDQVHIEWENFKLEGPKPKIEIKKDLEIAWKVCAHLKSNAISLVSQGQTVGLGMGQVDRVTAVNLAIERMEKHHPHISSPIVMASDGFFPFEDSVEQAASKGIQWIIQPGGSIRDASVIEKSSSLGVHMVLTGCRHFRH